MMKRFLPANLRLARMVRGLTLRDAAKQTGVTTGTLSDLERGLREPHPPTLYKIAQGYGIPVRNLLQEAEPATPLAQAPPLPEPPPEEVPHEEEEQRSLSNNSIHNETRVIGTLRVHCFECEEENEVRIAMPIGFETEFNRVKCSECGAVCRLRVEVSAW